MVCRSFIFGWQGFHINKDRGTPKSYFFVMEALRWNVCLIKIPEQLAKIILLLKQVIFFDKVNVVFNFGTFKFNRTILQGIQLRLPKGINIVFPPIQRFNRVIRIPGRQKVNDRKSVKRGILYNAAF